MQITWLFPMVALGLAAFGISLLLYPAKFQSFALRGESDNWVWRINPFKNWMKTPSYRVYLRFMGTVMLIVAAIMVSVLSQVAYVWNSR
jgi:hypothetical protein